MLAQRSCFGLETKLYADTSRHTSAYSYRHNFNNMALVGSRTDAYRLRHPTAQPDVLSCDHMRRLRHSFSADGQFVDHNRHNRCRFHRHRTHHGLQRRLDWIAGAIISGAYFGDKVSPLSDTTVIASSSCGVDLFDHIRYLMLTSIPAMVIALIVFMSVGLISEPAVIDASSSEIVAALRDTFNISLWTLIIPLIVGILIACRVKTLYTLAVGSVLGVIGIFVFQPGILSAIEGVGLHSVGDHIMSTLRILWSETAVSTGNEALDSFVSTGGITGMLPTIFLVLCAMLFGAAMIGTGMLAVIAGAFTRRLKRRHSIVGATVAGGLFLNSCTADQYLSIIIGSNMYRDVYKRYSFQPRLLSRTLEDSVSVTSVLIPWNSCGVTQSTVLGVATLTYLPFCIFNILSPMMTLLMAAIGFRIPTRKPQTLNA